MLCRGWVAAGTLWPTAPIVRVEDSPSPVYGAALLMRLGGNTLRGSNPRSSAQWFHISWGMRDWRSQDLLSPSARQALVQAWGRNTTVRSE